MKVVINKPVEIEVKYVTVVVPIRYGDEGVPCDFPFRVGDVWQATIDIDTGQIVNGGVGFAEQWPNDGVRTLMCIKVCDDGIYTLLDADQNSVAQLADYVPKLIPGEYGDYVALNIDERGFITNWPKQPTVDEFFNTPPAA